MRTRPIALVPLLLTAACGGTASTQKANELAFTKPAAATRFAPPASLTFDVTVAVDDTDCPGAEVIDVSAGAWTERGTPATTFKVPFSKAITTLASPDAEADVTLMAQLSCGGPVLKSATTTVKVKEAASAITIGGGLDATKIATLEYDSRGSLFTYEDHSKAGLLGPDFQPIRVVSITDAGFAGTAPDRRVTTCGPATPTGVPYCAYSTGGDDPEQRETVLGVMGAGGPIWKANLNRANFGASEPIAALVNGAQSFAYVVSPNKRLRAVAATGVIWDYPFSDANLQPGDALLRNAAGGLRAIVRLGTGLEVRDFSAQGIAGVSDEFPSQQRVLEYAFTGQRYAWTLDAKAFRFIDLEGDACTFDLPADETLVELRPGHHVVVGPAANGQRVAAFLATQTAEGNVTEFLVSIDSQCNKHFLSNPGKGAALREKRPGVAVTNDGKVFLFAGSARVYDPDLTLVRESSPALALGGPTVLCDQNICGKDDAGRIVAVPISPSEP